jgi:hypothetical protein
MREKSNRLFSREYQFRIGHSQDSTGNEGGRGVIPVTRDRGGTDPVDRSAGRYPVPWGEPCGKGGKPCGVPSPGKSKIPDSFGKKYRYKRISTGSNGVIKTG